MPLTSAVELLGRARAGAYAVGYFESWNLESLQGVVDAAEESRAPIFIGFNGEYLSRTGRLSPERLSWYAALGRAAAESATVPCGLVFNECAQDDWTRQAIDLGFGLVMPDDPGAPAEAFQARVTALVQQAHDRGAAVEAEVGHLPCAATGESDSEGRSTDPEEAARFVATTGIDLLAVSVGNVHILLSGSQGLDLDHLEAIHRRVDLPLDLHGGTGIAADSLQQAIRLGVAKVCYGTYLKQRYLQAVGAALQESESNPHHRLGWGGPEDLLGIGRRAVRDAVLERIDLLGCCGKA
ncbi:MAG: class II fructose-bisphosphate aldolase [Candidatus Latescibacterota bacterium]|jgi:ketose-bisphosphate aldolase